MEPSNNDLAVQIARLEGKVDGYQASLTLELANQKDRLREDQQDRAVLRQRIETVELALRQRVEALEGWKNKLTGAWLIVPAFALLLSAYAALKSAGIIH